MKLTIVDVDWYHPQNYLPPINTPVLVKLGRYNEFRIATWDGRRWDNDNWIPRYQRVTHWAPIQFKETIHYRGYTGA